MTASHAAGGARPVAAAVAAARGASPSIGPGKITTRGQEEGGPAWGATASRVVAVVPHRRLATWGAGSRRRRASLCSRCCAPPDRRGDPKANPPPHALCGLCLWWAPHGLPRSPGHHALFLERRVPPLPPRRPPNFSATAPAQLPCGVRRGGRPPRGVSGWQPAGEWARGGVRGVGPTPPQTDPSSGGAVGGGGGGGVCWRRARWARRWRAAAPKTRPLRATRVRSCGGPASTGSPVACGGGRWGGTRGSPPIASNGAPPPPLPQTPVPPPPPPPPAVAAVFLATPAAVPALAPRRAAPPRASPPPAPLRPRRPPSAVDPAGRGRWEWRPPPWTSLPSLWAPPPEPPPPRRPRPAPAPPPRPRGRRGGRPAGPPVPAPPPPLVTSSPRGVPLPPPSPSRLRAPAPARPPSPPPPCAICLSPLVPGGADLPRPPLDALPCRHAFHARCLDRWLDVAAACPLCRSPVAAAAAAVVTAAGGGDRFRGEAVPAWVHHRLVGT